MRNKTRLEILKEKENISYEEFFSSEIVKSYLGNLTYNVHRDFHIPNIPLDLVYKPCEKDLAFTNNEIYFINAGNEYLDEPFSTNINERLKCVLGLTFHEVGHRLFTNFMYWDRYISSIRDGKLFNLNVELKNNYSETIEEISEYLKIDYHRELISHLMATFNNIIEDRRMENILLSRCSYFTYLWSGLCFMRKREDETFITLKDNLDSMEVSLENSLFLMCSVVFTLAANNSLGDLSDEELNNSIIQKADLIEPVVKCMIDSLKAVDYFSLLNEILFIFWADIKNYLDSLEYDEDTDNNGDNNQDNNTTSSDEAEHKDDKENDNSNANSNEQKDIDSIIDALKDAIQSFLESNNINDIFSTTENANPDSLSSGTDDEAIYNVLKSLPQNNNINLDGLKLLIQGVKDEKETQLLEEQFLISLTADLKTSLLPGENPSNNKIIPIHATIDGIDKYNDIKAKVIKEAKKIVKESRNLFEPDEEGYLSGKYSGEIFNPSAICNPELRHFKKRVIEDNYSVAVNLIIDESGSMSGIRDKYAKTAALILMEYCSQMNIDCSVYGHNLTNHMNNIYVYSDVEHPSPNDAHKLFSHFCSGCNRDSAALSFCVERLKRSDAENKICFILSDGKPSAYNSGDEAFRLIRKVVKDANRNDILIIAAAIGEDRELIKNIYGKDNFLDISNLNTLANSLIHIIKKFIF